jgi:hypothetical protein
VHLGCRLTRFWPLRGKQVRSYRHPSAPALQRTELSPNARDPETAEVDVKRLWRVASSEAGLRSANHPESLRSK